jgi:Dipeptidyl aminopeptidases/acylaminoacyl-peptidases
MKTAIDDYPTRKKNNDYAFYRQNPEFDVKRFEHLKHKEISIVSKHDGITLKGTLIYAPHRSNNVIVFSHGITSSRWYILKKGRIDSLLNRGFNVLTFDHRAHGESEGEIPTYGYLEKYDLDQWVDTAANLFPKGKIGVEGVSMGAATAILHAGEINPSKDSLHKVSFYIFDCPYSDLEEQFAHRLNKDYHLPNMALTTSLNILNRPMNGFDIKDVSPIKAAPKIDVPVLFIHGMADDYVPTYMTTDMYKEVKSHKMLALIPKERHAQAINDAPLFWRYHDDFIRNVLRQWKGK